MNRAEPQHSEHLWDEYTRSDRLKILREAMQQGAQRMSAAEFIELVASLKENSE